MVESTWSELEAGQLRSQITPKQAVGSCLGWIASGIPIVMALHVGTTPMARGAATGHGRTRECNGMTSATIDKPHSVPVIVDQVPDELKQLRQWVVWRYTHRDGKWTKPPYQTNGASAKSTDPQTWTTFDVAATAYEDGGFDGVGFVLSADDPFIAIDLDHCVANGDIQPWTPQQREHKNWGDNAPDPAAIVAKHTYAEISPSGTGIRILARGNILKATKHGAFEVYAQSRYVTLTGHRLEHSPDEVTSDIDCERLRVLFDEKPQPKATSPHEANGKGHALDDQSVLDLMFQASNGEPARSLYEGDTSTHGGDHSAADQALCNYLAFYCGSDGHGQIDRLFRGSGLYRDKWEREDYRTRTIQNAIDSCSEFYQPKHSGNGNPVDTQQSSQDDNPTKRDRAPITLTGNLREDSCEAWQAIHQANEPPTLFRHGGAPARIEHDDSGAPIIKLVDQDKLRHFLARAADWKKSHRVNNRIIVNDVEPPMSVVRDILATPDMPLEVLTHIVQTPIFAEDGSLQSVPGYQPASKTFYAPQDGLKIPNVGDSPSEQSVQEAVSLIVDDLLFDFPFNGESERATAISLLLLPFARQLIEGATPLHLFEKPSPGTGATLMVDMLTYPTTGRPIATMTEGNSEDEWRKRITAKLMTGPQFLLIDNLRQRLDSAAVSTAITAPAWEDRILGVSTIVNLPVRCAWIATGNNPAVSSEIARRTVRCRLDTKEDRPWLRGGFKHPELRTWAQKNRGQLIWAALTIIRSWIVAGRPLASTKLGMFESWSAVMGGILSHAGISGFLDNLDRFYDESDAEGEQWRMLLVAWWTEHADRPVKAGDLYPLAEQCDMAIGGNSDRAQRTRFGKMLGQQRDRTFTVTTDEGTLSLRVMDAGKRGNAKHWKLERVDEGNVF